MNGFLREPSPLVAVVSWLDPVLLSSDPDPACKDALKAGDKFPKGGDDADEMWSVVEVESPLPGVGVG